MRRSSRVRGLGTRGWAVALMLSIAPAASAQEPELPAVLAKAGVYVVEFQRRLSGIVSEETYMQDVQRLSGLGRTPSLAAIHRELKSDLLLVKPAGVDRWLQFRDVFEV